MSQIINAIPADALLPFAGGAIGWVGHMLWFRAERANVTAGKLAIRRFQAENDAWLDGHKVRFAPVAAIEAAPAEEHPEAEVLHVEYPTGELRALNASDPQVAAGLAELAEEVGLAQALSDRPAEDEDEVGEEQPGEAWFEGLAQAWYRLRTWLLRVWSRRPDFLKSADQRASEFWEPTTEAEEREVLDEAWAQRTGRHGSDRVAEDTGYRGSRWAAGVEHTGVFPIVPAQREAAE